MKENPYSKIIEIIKKQGATSNPPSIQIGKVIEPPPKLIIKIDDQQIDNDNILIADYLLKDHQQAVDTIKKGDLLAVMPVYDRQLYIILARLKEVS